jgi:hypothetical protein
MKTLTSVFLGFLLVISAGTGYSQTRSAKTPKFFIGGLAGFDQFANDSAKKANQYFAPLGTPTVRYINLLPQDSALGMNSEDRNIWDYPSFYPAPDNIVLGGDTNLDVLMLEPQQLFTAVSNAQYIRFEFERHTQQVDTNEYPGFLTRTGLTGRNVKYSGASYPSFLKGSVRSGDTSVNAVQLDTAIDTVGVFADNMWTGRIFEGPNSPVHQFFTGLPYQRKMLMRIRVKVTQPIDTSNPPILFIVTRTEKYNDTTTLVTHSDTVKVDTSVFKHINSDFDIVELRFIRDAPSVTTDTTTQMYFSFNWPKKVSAVFDYMELMTAHINSTDNHTSVGNAGQANIDSGEAASYSAEDIVSSNPVDLEKLVSRIKTHYQGHVNYIRIADEFPSMMGLAFKRVVKLLHDSTGGDIEAVAFTVDSGAGWFGAGLPNDHVFDFEASRLGWVDTSKYADPKMLFYDPYCIANRALPKRTSKSDSASIAQWENSFAPYNDLSTTTFTKGRHYTRNGYLDSSQYQSGYSYYYYLQTNRHLRRWTERQANGSHYGIDWQAGTAAVVDSNAFLVYGGARPPTAPEMKVTGHLAVSNGCLGLYLYLLTNTSPGSVSYNGGIMTWNGNHDSMYYTQTVNGITGRLWLGFKERYDILTYLIPILIKYGSTLVKDTCIGDWTAAELPNAPSATRNMLPFVYNSIVAQDDSTRKDTLVKNDSITNKHDTANANRTFVHVSMWRDTSAAADSSHSDTLLYITNMRTDDSWDTTGVPTTIDRRLITMRLKRQHIIMDVLDTNGGQLDDGRIWTPHVGVDAGDSLKLYLLPGDGILVRLMDTVYGTSRQTSIAMNFPKGGGNFNDKGRIKFDRPVAGVKNKTSDWSIPSSHLPYIVGIPDTTHAQMWQDSLLYQRVDSVKNSRPGMWRNQDWTQRSSPPVVTFNFKRQLSPTTAGRRDAQVSTDSVAHKIVITNDFEGTRDTGKIRLHDPFLVDSLTLLNVNDTLSKKAPFLPQILKPFRGQGVDSEHYGGIFLKQDLGHDTTKPIYALKSYPSFSAAYNGMDTINDTTFWVFLHWVSSDTIVAGDGKPWLVNPLDDAGNDFPLINLTQNPDVVFGKDSAQYRARYKAHMAAFKSTSDSGFLWNNQRKFYYLYTDTSGKKWYRIVYSSKKRIFTALGSKTGTNDISWQPEQLVSEWEDTRAEFPAMGLHEDSYDTSATYVYQTTEPDGTSEIKIAKFINGLPTIFSDLDQDPSGMTDFGASPATPVVYSVEGTYGRIDVAAWASTSGIAVKAIGQLGSGDGLGDNSEVRTTNNHGNPEFFFGNSTARHPTIWVDTAYYSTFDSSAHLVTLAWQQDTIMNVPGNRHQQPTSDSTFMDIFVVQFDVVYSKMLPYIKFYPHPGISLSPTDVSYILNANSRDNRNACISGARTDTNKWIIRLSYESTGYNVRTVQGIQVGYLKNGGAWTGSKYFVTTDTVNDLFTRPSIEVSRYFDSTGVPVKRDNYYSLGYERFNNTQTQHWAMNELVQRVAPTTYTNISNPQLAVVKQSIDDRGYRIGFGGSEPKHFFSSNTSLFKLVGNDTLWSYHFVTESDSLHTVSIEQGIGELSVDNETTLKQLELNERSEDEIIDAGHESAYFMQSENFTLPKSGTFTYYCWVAPSVDSLATVKLDTIEYALDFYDTTGTFVCRLDSLVICDSVNYTSGTKQITLSRDSDTKGYARFRRITPALTVSSAKWEPIITQARLSHPVSNKRSINSSQSMSENDLTFTAEPNPSRGDVKLNLGIPFDGMVSIEAYNQLGLSVSEIAKGRELHSGMHELTWHTGKLPSGVYFIRLQYGNLERVLRVIYLP